MNQGPDVRYINPFLQSSISVLDSMTQIKLKTGRPALADLTFEDSTFLLQVGITGQLKGQTILAMGVDVAMDIASRMMGGMPVTDMGEMPRSALSELSNMIMGNAATLFSGVGIVIDITPPISMLGNNLSLQADVDAIKVPLLDGERELVDLYVCISES